MICSPTDGFIKEKSNFVCIQPFERGVYVKVYPWSLKVINKQ